MVSVIVPVTERPEPLVDLYHEYAGPLRATGRSFEFLFAYEPWAHGLVRAAAALARAGEPVRVLEVANGAGETTLLKAVAARARGGIVVTLPAYRRVEPAVLPELIAGVEQGADVVLARRWPRRDSWINRIQNRLFHLVVGRVSGGELHDIACGVRAMRREVLLDLPVYGDLARFLPLFAVREGYDVREIDAPQHEADVHTRIYSPGTYLRRLLDVLGLFFLLRFTDKPLRFFGVIGSTLLLGGAALLLVLFVQRLGGQGIANRPFLLLGALLAVLGVQAIALGLVGEIIVYLHAPSRRPYRLARTRAARSEEATATPVAANR
ncbi:MAG TPA: hypothetical protein VIL18_00990 [Longimicrobiales bacterium]